MGTIPLPIPVGDYHRAGHPEAFSYGQPKPCPLCLPAEGASVRRDTPRGPTATELRRRALAHEVLASKEGQTLSYDEAATIVRRCDYCGALSPAGCPMSPCSYHGR